VPVDCPHSVCTVGDPPRALQRRLAMPSLGWNANALSLASSEAGVEFDGNERASEYVTAGRIGGSMSGVSMVEVKAAHPAGVPLLEAASARRCKSSPLSAIIKLTQGAGTRPELYT